MKTLIVAFAFVTVLFTVWVTKVDCALCTVNSDCNESTTCVGANKPICEHPDPSDVNELGGLCTCSVGLCYFPSDCKVPEVVLECDYDDRHCYDNKCICTRFPVFPGRK